MGILIVRALVLGGLDYGPWFLEAPICHRTQKQEGQWKVPEAFEIGRRRADRAGLGEGG